MNVIEWLRQVLQCRDRPKLRFFNSKRISLGLVEKSEPVGNLDVFLKKTERDLCDDECICPEERVYVQRQIMRDLLHSNLLPSDAQLNRQLLTKYIDLCLFENDLQQVDALLRAAISLRMAGDELGQAMIYQLRQACNDAIDAWKRFDEQLGKL